MLGPACGASESGPSDAEAAAEQYLTALRDGDTSFVTEMAEDHDAFDPDNPFWNDPVYSDAWDFEVFSQREQGIWIFVPYEIISDQGSDTGSFAFQQSDEETIVNPLAKADLWNMTVDYLDLTGVTSDDEYLPPGVYDLYPTDSEFFEFESQDQVLVTESEDHPDHDGLMPIEHRIDIPYELTEAGAEVIASEVRSWLEMCASEGSLSSEECQRAGGAIETLPQGLEDESVDPFQLIDLIQWEVREVPLIEVAQADHRWLDIDTNQDARAFVKFTFEDDHTLSMECDIDLEHIRMRIPEVDQVELDFDVDMLICD